MSDLQLDEAVLDEIASRMDLRAPNRDAAESVVATISQHLDVIGSSQPLLAVVDAATAVGKTYTAAAIIDYLAQVRGWSDFVIVTPGRVVRDKTIQNFTAGSPRSLVERLASPIEVVTAENFATLQVAAVMDDPGVVKVYILTVQALTAPASAKLRKKTHDYQEAFGAAFYQRLREVENLVVLADEYHEYGGAKFSAALGELDAKVTVGLTATPSKKDEPNVVYRYPLAAAIAERYVKVPCIVGRADDRADLRTKLADGMHLVAAKRRAAEANADRYGKRINPVMLVVANDTAEADEIAAVLRQDSFEQGRYADAVLVVHSNVTEDDEPGTWDKLAAVEDPDSPVRVIVSVGMLKEGWDVKNVFVLLSTRASVSSVLTEQTLGRGLRLPYGQWVDVAMLNTLEVLAHEKYASLLANAGLLNEQFVSFTTRAKAARDAEGRQVLVTVKDPVEVTVSSAADEPGRPLATSQAADGHTGIRLTDMTARRNELETARAVTGPAPVARREGAPEQVQLPCLTLVGRSAEFSLTQITDRRGFRDLGRSIAAEPERYLKRTMLAARLTRNPDGTLVTRMSQEDAADRVEVSDEQIPVEKARAILVDAVMSSEIVTSRAETVARERAAAGEIVDEFIAGLNGDAATLLSAYLARATSRLLGKLAEEQKRFRSKPVYDAHVEFVPAPLVRTSARGISSDRTSRLSAVQLRATAFEGWARSVFTLDWFDSDTERQVALLLDAPHNPILWWLRLQNGDLPIRLADGSTTSYNPDFLAVDEAGTHWVVEAKREADMRTEQVTDKAAAAAFWVNNVNATRPAGTPAWRYLLASESDVKDAAGSWAALIRLAGAD